MAGSVAERAIPVVMNPGDHLILKIMVQTIIPKSLLPLPYNSQGVPCFGYRNKLQVILPN